MAAVSVPSTDRLLQAGDHADVQAGEADGHVARPTGRGRSDEQSGIDRRGGELDQGAQLGRALGVGAMDHRLLREQLLAEGLHEIEGDRAETTADQRFGQIVRCSGGKPRRSAGNT